MRGISLFGCLALVACGGNAGTAAPREEPTTTTSPTEPTVTVPTVAPTTTTTETCFHEDAVADNAVAVGITASGDVVGNLLGTADPSATTATHAFVWSHGTLAQLPSLGGESTFAIAMNDAGDVVGVAAKAGEASPSHAVLWHGGAVTALGELGASSRAARINANGDVAGTALAADETTHAVLWKAGAVQDLGLATAVVDLDAKGDVLTTTDDDAYLWNPSVTSLGAVGWFARLDAAGDVVFNREDRVYVWSNAASTELVPFAGEADLAPAAVTSAGAVLGTAQTATGEVDGFLWANGATTTLGANFAPRGANASLEVVGAVGLQAAAWKNGQSVMLSAATPDGAYAVAVNDAAEVVGEVGQSVKRWSTAACFER